MPLPIRTDRSLRTVPYVTYALLFINVLVFLSTLGYSEAKLEAYQNHWGIILTHPSFLTLFTHGFIHADQWHLLGNLLILWIVGTVLEDGIGSVVFLLLYLASQVAAVLLNGVIGGIFNPGSLSMTLIGASGSIAGITGFAAFRYYYLRIQTIILFPNIFQYPVWLPALPIPYVFWVPFWTYALYFGGRELIFGLMLNDNIAHWAHLGGMGLGMAAAGLLSSFQEGKREQALEETTKVSSGEIPQQRSLDELQRLLRANPHDPELLDAMARIAIMNNELDSGCVLYTKAIPYFLQHKDIDRAAASYVNLLRIAPESAFPLREQMALAARLESMGHFPEAIQAFALIVQHHPHSDEAQTAILRAAQIHGKHLQDAPAAIALLNHLLETYPESHWVSLAKDRLRGMKGRS